MYKTFLSFGGWLASQREEREREKNVNQLHSSKMCWETSVGCSCPGGLHWTYRLIWALKNDYVLARPAGWSEVEWKEERAGSHCSWRGTIFPLSLGGIWEGSGRAGGHEQGWLVSCCCCKVLWFALPKSLLFLRPKKMDDEYVLVCKMGDLGPMRHMSSSEFSMKQWKLYLKNVKGVATIPVGIDIMGGWIEALGY